MCWYWNENNNNNQHKILILIGIIGLFMLSLDLNVDYQSPKDTLIKSYFMMNGYSGWHSNPASCTFSKSTPLIDKG